MPLRMELKPYELFVINGARIRNGDRKTEFLIENNCRFLRESEIIEKEEVHTPFQDLYWRIQKLHLDGAGPDELDDLITFIQDQFSSDRVSKNEVTSVQKIFDELRGRNTHRALKVCKSLIEFSRP